MNTKLLADMATVKVRGGSLEEAKNNVRSKYGDDALIVNTGTRCTPRKNGLGELKTYEITVALPTAKVADPVSLEKHTLLELSNALESEVERIEAMVTALRGGGDIRPRTGLSEFGDYPLAKSLLANGASMPAVRHLANLFRAEGGDGDDPVAHLRSIFQTSNAKLGDLSGCHVFLGNSGAGKTEMILSLARELAATKKILVLTLYPRDEADTQRLRDNSEKSGFDAAVLRDGQQLMSAMQLVDGYDLVLIDTPALQSPVMAMAPVQQRIVQENRMHRHLVVAMDHDLRDTEAIWHQTREWNCDWMALSRLDMLDRPGKLLDLLLNSPLSVSLRAGGLRHERDVDVVTDAWLVHKSCRATVAASQIDTSKQAEE